MSWRTGSDWVLRNWSHVGDRADAGTVFDYIWALMAVSLLRISLPVLPVTIDRQGSRWGAS